MAVGSIANISVSAYTTYINVSFKKPANTTKFLVVLVDPNTGYTFYSNYFLSSNATGNTVTCKVTGVLAGGTYLLYVTPYNGTVAGTKKQYLNSPLNLVKIPSSSTAAQASSSSGTSTSKTSSATSGPVTTSSSSGSTSSGGSIAPSSAAPSNTPVFNAGSVSGSAPSDINSSARISQKVEGLNPNTPYSIDIRAVTTDASGNTIYSEWSPKLNLITPGYSTDGNNFQSVNNATDIQLSGGSIFAGTFDTSTGIIDVVNDNVSGSGVILNQTGLLGVNSGTKQFYIDARTGNAYFAGTIQATIIESTGYTGVTDGTAYSTSGTAFNLNNGSITSKNFRIDTSGNAYFAGTVAGTATINGTPASQVVSNAATGITKNVTFTQGTQPTALNIGDLWYDSSNGFKSYRWNGTSWVSIQDTAIASAASAASTANTNALAAQASANGKNRIIYGAKTPPSPHNTDVTYGQAPDLTYYQITQGTTTTSVNSSTGSVTTSTTGQVNTFPSSISNTSGNIAGDTWFVLNISGNVIAQYTVNAAVTQWVWTQVSSQIIGNLDAGMITTGTLSAVNINNNTGTFAVDTYGNLKATSAYISGQIVGASFYIDGYNYWNYTSGSPGGKNFNAGTSTTNINMNGLAGSITINTTSPNTGFYIGSDGLFHSQSGSQLIQVDSTGMHIRGMQVYGNDNRVSDYYSSGSYVNGSGSVVSSAPFTRSMIYAPNSNGLSDGGDGSNVVAGDIATGFAIYYGKTSTGTPSGGTGLIGDLFIEV